MVKVTMVLTDRDAKNVSFIREATSARSNAHAVSIAVSLMQFVTQQLQTGTRLLLEHPNGERAHLVMAELEKVHSNSRPGH